MITEFFITLGSSIGQWLISILPTGDPPAFLAQVDDNVNLVLANLGGVSVWADWVYILAVVGSVLLVWGISFGIKVFRAAAAHIPFLGGSG